MILRWESEGTRSGGRRGRYDHDDHRGLVGLRVGDVLVGARLALWEQELAAREVMCLVGALVRLGDGVPLVAGTGAPSPTAPAP